ncbi:MAG: SDR family NAD(P)-dependent oxidoreductase [Spirochaetes bacterium]|nr:SDR family NAD(P)-dependent oxidoreductase [Spirochaetota bacterium]
MKLAVITGCDSGIGKSLARVFSEKGFRVIISYLERNPFEGDRRIIAKKLDIRDEKQINSFSALVHRYCSEGHGLEYFINNAGVALGGPFENIPLEIYRTVMEINFIGLASLSQKILPALIRSRGRLVVNGSMAGRIALPFLSPYTASKFALEGWCDSVRRELKPLGVRTILLETAGIATPIWDKGLQQDYSFADKKYDASIRLFKEKFIAGGNRGMDTDRAAAQIFRFITEKKPKARYIVAQNRLLSFLELMIPGRVLDALVVKMFSMRYEG